MIKNKLLLLLSPKKIKKDDDDDKEEEEEESSVDEINNNIITKLTFNWLNKLVIKAYQNDTLDLKDTPKLPNNLKSNFTTKSYLNNLKSYINTSNTSNYSLIFYFYKNFLFLRHKKVILLNLLLILISAFSPYSLQLFIEYIQLPKIEKSFKIGIFYCLLLFISSVSNSLVHEIYYWYAHDCKAEIRGSLKTLIFEKLLKLSNSSKSKYNSAKISNLITTDVDIISNFFWARQTQVLCNPIQVLFLFYYLISVVGLWSGLIGIIVMIITIPINSLICDKGSNANEKSSEYSDKRCNTTNEFINGIRFIKMYTYEKFFIDKIEKQREKELKLIFIKVIYWTLETVMIYSSSSFVLVATFATYTLLGNKTITLEVAFTAMSILDNLKSPLINIPYDYYSVKTLIPSCKRIRKFLICSELQDENSNDSSRSNNDIIGDINIKNGTFKWNQDLDIENSDSDDSDEDKDQDDNLSINYTLNNINFKAPYGKLTMICSPIGTGKSSLLSALLGEMYKVEGQVTMLPNNISYTSQQPFLLNTSLRENILFGKPMNLERYKKVIQACSLISDLSEFPALDLTEIGERGINLSGGQKQRISLARALYANSDCYLLDEPLSAVDSKVCAHLFEHCIQGMMANKTRILVTHQIQFIKFADHIVLIDKKGSIIQGTYNELINKGIDFQSIIDTTGIKINQQEETVDKQNSNPNSTIEDLSIDKVIMNDKDFIESNFKLESKILVDEDKDKGNIGINVYKSYLKYGSTYLFFIISFLMFFSSQIVSCLCDYWITYWTEQSISNNSNHGQFYYIGLYFAIICLYILTIILAYLMLSKVVLNCSKKLHSKLLSSISLAPVQFFDSNPSGRILNRFSNDLAQVDLPMMDILSDALRAYSAFIIGIASIVYINPMTIIPFIILSIFYYFFQSIYRPSVREMNRLESISESPVLSLLQECHNGLTTIRSFKQQSTFIEKMNQLIDDNQRCDYSNYALYTWISIRLETLSSIIVFLVSLFSLYSSSTNVGLSLLAVNTALTVTGNLNSAINQTVDLEGLMNSFQRIDSFIKTPPEAPQHLDTDDNHSLNDWPNNGEIEFKKVEIKYSTAVEPSLKKLSFSIKSNEKIGICGRTGAGKTTIASSLFRLVECSNGSIIIDGIDISKIGLKKLRSSIGVVPQDPWLFSSTIRSNIDPFNQYSDEKIWSALESVFLNSKISEMPLGLKTKLTNDGQCFSFGEKQLLSISRCILKNPKIILLDEPSSSIDFNTADLIKNVLAEKFNNNTVITIAHRLDTIINSSKIALIDKGQLIEFDTPNNLIENNNSKFKKLLNFYNINK